MKPIKLFWWNKASNFGDAINPTIVSYVSGREVEWASPDDCELVAIGSVMSMVAPAIRDKNGPKKIIWGSGQFSPSKLVSGFGDSEHVDVVSTRGPISAVLSNSSSVPMGDPGLLADRVYGNVEKTDRIGVVPHHSQWRNQEFIAQIRKDKRFKLINVRRNNPEDVVRDIASCEYIISCSLHGLVVADSYNIPNYWVEGPSLAQSDLKFADYALSVGRSLLRPRSFESCLSDINSRKFDQFWYLKHLDEIKDSIESAFPLSMKGQLSENIRTLERA